MVSFGKVTGRYISAHFSGSLPVPAQGTVTFTPQAEYILNPGDATTLPSPVVAVLDTQGYLCSPQISLQTQNVLYDLQGKIRPGIRGVQLIATNDPESNPTNWTWKVDFDLSVSGKKVPYQSFSFALPMDEEVDITSVTPVPGVSGHSTIQGPAGTSVSFIPSPEDTDIIPDGAIYSVEGKLYGNSDGSQVLLADLESGTSSELVETISRNGVNLDIYKTSDGFITLEGTLFNPSTTIFDNLGYQYGSRAEQSFPVVENRSGEIRVFTVFTNGSFQVPEGSYSICLRYRGN